MGGLTNIDRTGNSGMPGVIAVGDAFCHTDPAFAYGLSFALARARWATPRQKLPTSKRSRSVTARTWVRRRASATPLRVRWTPRVPDA